MLMPDATANIWLADELKPRERSWTNFNRGGLPQHPFRYRQKTQLKKKEGKDHRLRSAAEWSGYPYAKSTSIRSDNPNNAPKSPLTKSALSYMECHYQPDAKQRAC
jgi:hypothetical protein